jgi:nicotinate-nucleotide--dimethylbenzimidazole phosphoribosyltransferase
MNRMNVRESLLQKINNKTKPPGALGMLEPIALQIGLIQNTVSPSIINPHIVVFAGDHGIAAPGTVNPYPQAVTAQMVFNFIAGGAAINVFCRQHHIRLKIVDAGVNIDFDPAENICHHKISKATNDYSDGTAMSVQQCNEALAKGAIIVEEIFNSGCNCIGFGEMGIGNTSSASLIMSATTGIALEECVGRGTGSNDEQLEIKKLTLKKIFDKHRLDHLQDNAIELLSCIGGFEIVMMTGAYLKAAALNMIIVVDGFISTAALLAAQAIDKDILNNCIFAHTSGEKGHEKMLAYMGAKPLLNLGMRLGEGTGAALAIPFIQSAVNFLNEMASFETAGVSNR